MKPSIVFFGKSKESEGSMSEALGGDAQRFFLLAQRVVWGTDQSDLIKVDVPRTLATLMREFPDAAAAHALAAYGWRKVDRQSADAAMERAWELEEKAGPETLLPLPTPEEWQGKKPEQQLECLLPKRVWRVTSYDAVTGMDLARDNGATLVRTEDAGLVCINPVNFSQEVAEEIRSLGTVGALAVQGKGHSRGLVHAAKIFPEARTYATQEHRSHPPCAELVFDRCLDEESPSQELQLLPVRGSALSEIALFHEPTRLLIAQDLLRGNFAAREQSFASRLYAFSFGIHDRVGLMGMQLFLVSDWQRFKEGIASIAAMQPEHVVAAHHTLIDGADIVGLSDLFEFARQTSVRDHKKMLLRYFFRQPSFLRDLIRYKRKQKRIQAQKRRAGE